MNGAAIGQALKGLALLFAIAVWIWICWKAYQ